MNDLAERYRRTSKSLKLKQLRRDCLELLDQAKDMTEINCREDPHYKVADDKWLSKISQ